MTLEALLSCMHQDDHRLAARLGLTGNVLIVNQCDRQAYAEHDNPNGSIRMFSTTQRGLTRSRNMAIEHARADICLLCDDDERFAPDYQQTILDAYQALPRADVIVFKLNGLSSSLGSRVRRLRFPQTMKVCSCQITFRRASILDRGLWFDPLLGAGSGNGGEEELKFLTDCEKAGLRIYYVPSEIAFVEQKTSTWFDGFTETFFENRGATTRYILGAWLSALYAVYYAAAKRSLYRESISPARALRATFRGIRRNRIAKQKANGEQPLAGQKGVES